MRGKIRRKTKSEAVQPKLKIGQPGDQYEQEADAMADRVVSNAAPEPAVQMAPSKEDEAVAMKTDEETMSMKSDEEQVAMSPEDEEGMAMKKEDELAMKVEDERVSAKKEDEVSMKEEDEVAMKEDEDQISAKEEEVSMKKDEEVAMKEEDEQVSAKEEDEVSMKEDEDAVTMKEEEKVMAKDEEEVQKKPAIQKSGDGATYAAPSIAQQIRQTKGQGGHLGESAQQELGQKMGADFSGVKIHTDEKAASLSESLGAKAFTHGQDIYFNKGNFNPGTKEGKHLLAHELTHTIQQKGGFKERKGTVKENAQPSIQRLVKSKEPWTGAVITAPSVSLMDAAKGKATLASLAPNTLVKVLGNAAGWLNVEVDTKQGGVTLDPKAKVKPSGDKLTGYLKHTHVDDAVVASMTGMLGEKATWKSSGPGKGTTFERWASAATEATAPPIVEVTTINCWEMILIAAYKFKVINWQWIHDLYTNTSGNWYKELPKRLTKGPLINYDVKTKTPQPERGDLVFFSGAAHVTLATGKGDELLTFWPPPNEEPTKAGTVDEVKMSTIEDLHGWIWHFAKFTPKMKIGKPAW